MAKNAKKQPTTQGKPITAFFARATKGPPASSSQDVPTSSQPSPAVPSQSNNATQTTQPAKSKVSNGVKSIGLASGSRDIVSSKTVQIASPRRSERRLISTSSSLKRSRSPDTQTIARSSTPASSRHRSENPKTPEQRKSIFDSDSSGGEVSKAVIYVKSTPNPQQRKKARLSSPPESLIGGLVPSSQSDEEELVSVELRTLQSSAIQKQVPLPTPDHDGSFAMLIDEVDIHSSPLTSPIEGSKAAELPSRVSHTNIQILTPPSSDLPSIPPTPVALDQASKTAKIIADIKARAYERSLSSPEPYLHFNEELESSDDDDLPPIAIVAKTSKRDDAMQGVATTSNRTTTRYSLRNRSGSPPEPQPTLAPVKAVPQAKPGKKATSTVPFAALLKEKKQAVKRGKDDAALLQAEQTALKYARKDLVDEMDNEDDDDDDDSWNLSNLSSGGIRNLLQASALTKEDSDSDISIGQEDRTTLFKVSGGKDILSILEKDKAAIRDDPTSEKDLGIKLWSTTSDLDAAMMVDERYHIPGTSPIVRLLNASLQHGDIDRASTLLNMNLLLSVNPNERAGVASYLCDLSLSTRSSALSEAAANTLINFWSSSMQPISSTISFTHILASLKRMGGSPTILSSLPQMDGVPEADSYCQSNRNSILDRLVLLVQSCARSRRLNSAEVQDIVVSLALIGMDSETSPNLSRDIVLAIGLTIDCLAPSGVNAKEKEFLLCLRLLNYTASYEPINKLRLLALFANGSGPTRRIANFTAYCIITDNTTPSLGSYTNTPPLGNILDQLVPYSKADLSPPGKFAIHEATDYDDLGFYINILSAAVSNLKEYAAEEREQSKGRAKAASLESSAKSGDKPKTDLQLLHTVLETLHSNISDTRATHLERSRTKACIKGLAMNVHYQREIWMRNNREGKGQTIPHWFQRKS